MVIEFKIKNDWLVHFLHNHKLTPLYADAGRDARKSVLFIK